MAERRMFAKSIVLSDAFLDMPLSARCLYFTLGMLADDDGFIGSPKSVMRQCGASQDDMAILLQKRYVLAFESGVIVIKHWRMNNYLQNDRKKSTTYLEELGTLVVDKRGAYTEAEKPCIQNVYTGKDSIGKDSIDNNIYSQAKPDDTNPESDQIKEIIDYLNSVLGTKYTTKSKSTNQKIKARLAEGHTVEDFKTVIDKKHKQWSGDPDMAPYLRPETLFAASHFESYLNEIETDGPKKKNKAQFDSQRKYDYDDLLKSITN